MEAERSILYVWTGSYLYVLLPNTAEMMPAIVVTLELISTEPDSVIFSHGNLEHARAGWRTTYDHQYHIYFISTSEDFDWCKSACQCTLLLLLTSSQAGVVESGSGLRLSPASKIMDSDSDVNDDDMKIDNGHSSNSSSLLDRFLVTNVFS